MERRSQAVSTDRAMVEFRIHVSVQTHGPEVIVVVADSRSPATDIPNQSTATSTTPSSVMFWVTTRSRLTWRPARRR